jgi:ComF family protein
MLWGHGKKIIFYGAQCCEMIRAIIAPPRKHTEHIAQIRLSELAVAPKMHDLLENDVITLMSYHAPHVKDIILALKFEQSSRSSQLCARVLADYLEEDIQSVRSFTPRNIIIMPIPLHASRLKQRGFNQMERICNTLPVHLRDGSSAHLQCKNLMRIHASPPQARLGRKERLSNLRDAFAVKNPALLKGAHVYLIDDVTTTGATLFEAAKTLRHTHCTVTCIALARA